MSEALIGAPLTGTAGLQPANANAGRQDAGAPSEQMKKLAEQFEAMFLNEMMGPMFAGLDTDGLGGGGAGEQMFRPMLIDQYAEAISHSGGIGLADALVREFARLQTLAPAPDAETPDAPAR